MIQKQLFWFNKRCSIQIKYLFEATHILIYNNEKNNSKFAIFYFIRLCI